MTQRSTPARVRGVAWLDIGATAVAVIAFGSVAWTRFLDTDEGYHALAAQRILDGALPYRDFFYPQTPLTAFAYAGWASIGASWHSLRILSALLAVALAAVAYSAIRAREGARVAFGAVVVLAASSLAFGWYTTIKTHTLSTLLLFAAYVCARERTRSVAGWVACGAFAGLAVDTRLLYAAAIPALIVAALTSLRPARAATALVVGFVAVLTPLALLYAAAPDQFAFDNLGYHGVRSGEGLVGNGRQKLETLANLVGVGTTDGAIGARAFGGQFLLLLIGAAAAGATLRPLRRDVALALAIAALLAAASLLPTPAQVQYFAALIPFLVVALAAFAAETWRRVRDDDVLRRGAIAVAAVALAVYLASGLADAVRYASVAGSEGARIGFVERVAQTVDERTNPGDVVLTTWPGYLVGTDVDPVRGAGLANFALIAADQLSRDEARRGGVLQNADVERVLRERVPALVVFQPWEVAPTGPDWPRRLTQLGYREVERQGSVRFFAARG